MLEERSSADKASPALRAEALDVSFLEVAIYPSCQETGNQPEKLKTFLLHKMQAAKFMPVIHRKILSFLIILNYHFNNN